MKPIFFFCHPNYLAEVVYQSTEYMIFSKEKPFWLTFLKIKRTSLHFKC